MWRLFVIFYAIIFSVPKLSYCQDIKLKFIDSLTAVEKIDVLTERFGENKCIPNDYKIHILFALSYYPELCNTKIEVKYAKIKTSLNVRPTVLSTLFNHKSNRKYIIRINNSKKQNKVLINHANFNAKIGIFGHELGHIYDFSQLNTWGIIKRALYFTSKNAQKEYENQIDILTINRGLGWQLYDWSYFVLYSSCATDKYKLFKKTIYLTPEQIKNQMIIDGYKLH